MYTGRWRDKLHAEINLALREHLRNHETFTVDQILRDFLRTYH